MAMRACDGCFTRKIRCVQQTSVSTCLPNRTQCRQSDQSHIRLQVEDAVSPGRRRLLGCQPCQEILMECTYDRPRQRRPRRSKISLSVHNAALDVSSSPASPDLPPRSIDGGTPSSGTTSHVEGDSPEALRARSLPEFQSIEPNEYFPSDASIFGLPRVGTRQVFDLMIKDYLDLIYPLIPLVHRPTFLMDIVSEKADTDPLFYSQLLGIFATVVAALPRRFLDYKKAQWLFGFRTPEELVMHLEQAVLKLRPYDYFEIATTQKCIIAYFFAVSFACLNILGRMTTYFSELWLLLKAVGAQHPITYKNLDYVEAQLRKKVFWLYVIFAVHERVESYHLGTRLWDPIPDQMLFNSMHFAALLPLQLDDEYITPSILYPQPSPETSLTAGFISLVRIYACMIDFPAENSQSQVREDSFEQQKPGMIWIRRSHADYEVLRQMFDRVRYVLDDLPPSLAAWQSDSHEDELGGNYAAKTNHLESIRANLHVTRLWARSLLFERLIAVDTDGMPKLFMDESSQWAERENCCEQLLHLLYNIKQMNLEPNGISLTSKIRQVAAPLLECSFEEHTSISKRARRYIEHFMELLTLLDQYSFQDTQVVAWRNFERQRREPASEFKDT